MVQTREMQLNLSDWEVRYILQSLNAEMKRLKTINETSDDEDKVADAGNDFLEVSGLFDRLSAKSVDIFGGQILDFDNAPV